MNICGCPTDIPPFSDRIYCDCYDCDTNVLQGYLICRKCELLKDIDGNRLPDVFPN